MDLDESLPNVKSDFNQMKQVLLNLFQNAIDATPAGAQFIYSLKAMSNIFVRFIDTGSGISADNPDVIFEPFFTTKITGVGLGWPMLKRLLRITGGRSGPLTGRRGERNL
jgi:signal transduction histidine kinase